MNKISTCDLDVRKSNEVFRLSDQPYKCFGEDKNWTVDIIRHFSIFFSCFPVFVFACDTFLMFHQIIKFNDTKLMRSTMAMTFKSIAHFFRTCAQTLIDFLIAFRSNLSNDALCPFQVYAETFFWKVQLFDANKRNWNFMDS